MGTGQKRERSGRQAVGSNGPVAANGRLVRRVNSTLVLSTLRSGRALSRAQIAKELQLNRSTVSNIVRQLLDDGLVRETCLERSSSGRPGMLLELNPEAGCLLGVDVNIDMTDAVLTDFVGKVLWSYQIETRPEETQATSLARVEGLIEQAMEAARESHSRCFGIGVAVAALVEPTSGMVVYAPHLGWNDVPVGASWSARFGLPVIVENEANAAAVGEHYYGHAARLQDFLFVSLGVGMAAGIFVNGRLLRGRNHFAGQVGHTVIKSGGEMCLCGRRGCWVTQVGLTAISRRLRAAVPADGRPAWLSDVVVDRRHHITLRALAAAAEDGDPHVLGVLEETARDLGNGIADLVNVFDPEGVVLGGAISPLVPFMLPAVQDAVDRNTIGHDRERVEVMPSKSGSRACAMGAVASVFDRIVGVKGIV